MMDEAKDCPDQAEGKDPEPCKLMISGFVALGAGSAPLEIRRGMAILSSDGQEIGKVAALVVNGFGKPVEQILLSRLPDEKGYWSVPIEHVLSGTGDAVQVDINQQEAGELPQWQMEN